MHSSDIHLHLNLQARAKYLQEVTLFADLKGQEDALEALASIMEAHVYQPNESIIREGESGSELYLLIEGQASVYKSTPEGDQYKVAILHGSQHACFGEGGLLGADARSATIKADQICHCLILNREIFERFSKKYPHWALPVVLRIAHAMMNRFRKTNNDLMLLYNALVAEIRGQ